MKIIAQTWTVIEDDVTHKVEYLCNPFMGNMTVGIDGDAYTLKSKFLFFGLARREAFRIGDTQALLVVGKNGRAQVLIKGKPIEED